MINYVSKLKNCKEKILGESIKVLQSRIITNPEIKLNIERNLILIFNNFTQNLNLRILNLSQKNRKDIFIESIISYYKKFRSPLKN